MKLDQEYFEKKCHELRIDDSYDSVDILHQIARDGAEAQRVAIKLAVKNYIDRGILLGTVNINGVQKAINSATVKWEVKGE